MLWNQQELDVVAAVLLLLLLMLLSFSARKDSSWPDDYSAAAVVDAAPTMAVPGQYDKETIAQSLLPTLLLASKA